MDPEERATELQHTPCPHAEPEKGFYPRALCPDCLPDAIRAAVEEDRKRRPKIGAMDLAVEYVEQRMAAAVRAKLERLIPEVCSRCKQHEDVTARPQLSSHERMADGMWMHHFRIETCGWSEQCHAGPLHEALRADKEENQP